MTDEFLTVAEASQKLGVSPRTIQRYCKQGRLNFRWVSGKRHKELRILPPITLDRLPGVKRKAQLNVADYVTRKDFDDSTSKLERELLKKDIGAYYSHHMQPSGNLAVVVFTTQILTLCRSKIGWSRWGRIRKSRIPGWSNGLYGLSFSS